jgi:hypothetical protein
MHPTKTYNLEIKVVYYQEIYKYIYLQCSMYTCEAMERDKLKIANQYFSHLASKQTDAMDAILSCCKLEKHLLKNLIGMYQIKQYIYKIYKIISIDVKLICIF